MSDVGEINRRIKSAAADIVDGRKGAIQTVISLINARMEMLKAHKFKEKHRNDDAE